MGAAIRNSNDIGNEQMTLYHAFSEDGK